MCLGIPGRVTETYREHDVLMGKVDFGGVLRRVCRDGPVFNMQEAVGW